MIGFVDLEWVTITSNPTATTIIVARAAYGSTAATHADNAYLYLMPINPIGSPKLGKDDSQLSGRDYNFTQNVQKELPLANPIMKGQMTNWVGENEASPANQKELWDYEMRLQAERSFFYGRRYTQGNAAVSSAGVTLTQDGGNSMTGGLHYFIGQHSGRSTTYSFVSQENLQTFNTLFLSN